MDPLKEFIRTHPLISANGVEKLLRMPTGTLRINSSRPIPVKRRKLIEIVLKEYGYKISNNQQRFVVKGGILGTMDGTIFKRADVPDGSIVAVVE